MICMSTLPHYLYLFIFSFTSSSIYLFIYLSIYQFILSYFTLRGKDLALYLYLSVFSPCTLISFYLKSKKTRIYRHFILFWAFWLKRFWIYKFSIKSKFLCWNHKILGKEWFDTIYVYAWSIYILFLAAMMIY